MITQKAFLGNAAILLCSSTLPLTTISAEPVTKPNVIIILVDDMGYGGVSCFDNKNYKTPEIDRLAAEGLKMTDFHSNGSVCSPTRAAMMTGRYPQRSGLAEVVRADPKASSHKIGKHGFDEFIGFVSGNVDAYSHRDQENVKDWWHGDKLTEEEGYHTDIINSNAVKFIEENKDNPFFLYVSHGAPHYPFQARASKIERGPNKGTIHKSAPKETYSNNPTDADFLMRHFILPVDEGVGMIRKKVEELGISNNTMIWFISDNGADPHNHTQSSLTRDTKASFYEGGHRVPAILWSPTKVKPGTVSNELMLTFDLMPTTIKLAGVTTPEGLKFDGRDIAPALFHNKTLPDTTTLWNRGKKGALRQGGLKLIIDNKGQTELYDLTKDPQEKNNLTDRQKDRVKEMKATYNALLAETRKDSPYPYFSNHSTSC